MNATSPGRGEPSEFPWYCGKPDAHPEHRIRGDGYYGDAGYICDGKPRPADPMSYAELRQRRGLLMLTEEDVLRMLRRAGQGYQLHSLYADPRSQAVGLVVVHPDLPPVHPFSEPPVLNLHSRHGGEVRVFDDEVWQLTTLTVLDAQSARLAEVAATELRAVAGFTLGYNPDWLTCPEPGCPDPTVSVSGEPDVRNERTLSELLHLALQHREGYHPATTPGVPS